MASSSNYEGTVPRAVGTGPKNLTKTGTGPQPRSPGVRGSVARTPRVRPGLADGDGGTGTPPNGGGAGRPRSTTPMASTPNRTINKPKTARPRRSGRLPKPRADFPSKI